MSDFGAVIRDFGTEVRDLDPEMSRFGAEVAHLETRLDGLLEPTRQELQTELALCHVVRALVLRARHRCLARYVESGVRPHRYSHITLATSASADSNVVPWKHSEPTLAQGELAP